MRISEIIVEERLRKIVSGIDSLATSMKRYGLLHPIIVEERQGRVYLIAGFRRLEAAKLLRWDEVEVKFKKELTELERKEIELEENIQRQQLSWDEEVDAVRELDTIKRKLYGSAIFTENGWGVKDTAEALQESERTIKRDIMISRALEVMPELRKSCKNKDEVVKVLRNERVKMKREEVVREAESKLEGVESEKLIRVIEGDCLIVMEELRLEGLKFNLAISDPPFGKELHHAVTAVETSVMTYRDNPRAANLKLYEDSIKLIAALLEDNSHFYMFFPLDEDYRLYLDMLRGSFDFVDDMPIVWGKGKGGYTTNIAVNRGYEYQMRYLPQYQPIFFAAKGIKRRLTKEMGNFWSDIESVSHKEHVAEAPSELFKRMIEQSSIVGESVIDPFAGSGSSGVAAMELRRRWLGIEKERDNIMLIKSRIYSRKEV